MVPPVEGAGRGACTFWLLLKKIARRERHSREWAIEVRPLGYYRRPLGLGGPQRRLATRKTGDEQRGQSTPEASRAEAFSHLRPPVRGTDHGRLTLSLQSSTLTQF